MGFAISWIAIKDRKLEEVSESLGVEVTNKTEEFPESNISGVNLPNGWCHIQFDEFDSSFINDNALEELSNSTDVLACNIEEHVMYSSACLWSNGSHIWSVEHDAQQDLFHISPEGTLPRAYQDIEKECFELQKSDGEDVDYIFEIPLLLAKSFVGIKHDEYSEMAQPYIVLRSTNDRSDKSKPWWKFW